MHRLLSISYTYLIPLLLSAVFSLKSFRLKWPGAFRIFSVFLITTFFIEVFAIAWKWELYDTTWWHYSRSNHWIYGAFIMIRQLFFLAYFHKIIDSPEVKKMIRMSVVPFVVLATINYFVIQTPHTVNLYTIIVANTITILLVLLNFRQILNEKRIINLAASTEVWIAVGTFMYYSATLPLFILFEYLTKEQPKVANSYFIINDALNVLMYTFYLISFLCKPHSLK